MVVGEMSLQWKRRCTRGTEGSAGELSLEQSRGEGAGSSLPALHAPSCGMARCWGGPGSVAKLWQGCCVALCCRRLSSTAALPVRPSPVFLGALPSSGQFLRCLIIALDPYFYSGGRLVAQRRCTAQYPDRAVKRGERVTLALVPRSLGESSTTERGHNHGRPLCQSAPFAPNLTNNLSSGHDKGARLPPILHVSDTSSHARMIPG